MSGPILPFPVRYRAALANEQLRRNLLRFQRFYAGNRAAVFERYAREAAALGVAEPTFAEQRRRLATAKQDALGDRRQYLQQFISRAEAAGAHVYVAPSAEDAVRYILDLCQRRGVRLFAKAKSMLSEELFLNHALEEAGIQAVETDLGEWIIQLAGETPSHMVVPAIHKNRQQCSEIVERAVGHPVSREDIPAITAAAREALRTIFATADVGMTGANALIAETGTVMLVTNEGNGRLVTSLPKTHVVLAGWEKLVPTFEDATAQLRLLARCGTTQDVTVYTTFITGPDRPDREEHIVIVDNGRSAMADDPRFADALRCIRCAACADVCPPYQVVGGHVFGYVYSGAIGLVNTAFHHGLDAAAGPQSLCVSCNACAVACPAEIPLPRQILDVRRMVVEQQGLALPKRVVLGIWDRPRLFDLLMRLASVFQAPLVRRERAEGRNGRRAPGWRHPGLLRLPLPELLRWRTVPALARRPARDRLFGRTFEPLPGGPLAESPLRGKTVAYFVQCITDRLAPEQAAAAVHILRRCGARRGAEPAALLRPAGARLRRAGLGRAPGEADDRDAGGRTSRLHRHGGRKLRGGDRPRLPPPAGGRAGVAEAGRSPRRADIRSGLHIRVGDQAGRRRTGPERPALHADVPQLLPEHQRARYPAEGALAAARRLRAGPARPARGRVVLRLRRLDLGRPPPRLEAHRDPEAG